MKKEFKLANGQHMIENTKLDFEISKDDMEYLVILDNFKFGRDYFL